MGMLDKRGEVYLIIGQESRVSAENPGCLLVPESLHCGMLIMLRRRDDCPPREDEVKTWVLQRGPEPLF